MRQIASAQGTDHQLADHFIHTTRRILGRLTTFRPGSGGGAYSHLGAQRMNGQGDLALPETTITGEGFHAARILDEDQPGYRFVLDLMATDQRFAFCKINHGSWERLALLEEKGIGREVLLERPGREIDAALGLKGRAFAEGGFLAELLTAVRDLPSPEDGMHFVASLSPWPDSDRIEGTPFQNRARCLDLIRHFVPEVHRRNVEQVGFTGHEFKVAAITGGLRTFLDALRERDVIFVGNDSNRALLDALDLPSLTVIQVDATDARRSRNKIRDALLAALQARQGAPRPPLLLGAAGETLTTWLVLQAWQAIPWFQAIDLGGTLAAYGADTAMRVNWTSAYQRQIAAALPKLGVELPGLAAQYFGPFGLRDAVLVNLALEAGVPAPASNDEIPTPSPAGEIAFIENKPYDFRRMGELLSLSIRANHHANGGPVANLLERMIAQVAGLPPHRRVVAVSNGTAALHMACGVHALRADKPAFRWVTSAFGFFSANIGPLGAATVIDCDARGRFDLDALKALPLSDFDGVIYTNVFAQQSDWDDVAAYCSKHGKAFVIDNATGLLDRPRSALRRNAPIETISAHHTKPWGVGEGGFVVCDADQETDLRMLANFAAQLGPEANPFASNFKMSDLAAAAIIDRLERMPYWSKFYRWQERRMHSLLIDAGLPVEPFSGTTQPKSPRAHTPFLAAAPVDIRGVEGPVTLRKYYRPVRQSDGRGAPVPNAERLYARCFSLSNAPEMRLAENRDIIDQLGHLVGRPRPAPPPPRG